MIEMVSQCACHGISTRSRRLDVDLIREIDRDVHRHFARLLQSLWHLAKKVADPAAVAQLLVRENQCGGVGRLDRRIVR